MMMMMMMMMKSQSPIVKHALYPCNLEGEHTAKVQSNRHKTKLLCPFWEGQRKLDHNRTDQKNKEKQKEKKALSILKRE